MFLGKILDDRMSRLFDDAQFERDKDTMKMAEDHALDPEGADLGSNGRAEIRFKDKWKFYADQLPDPSIAALVEEGLGWRGDYDKAMQVCKQYLREHPEVVEAVPFWALFLELPAGMGFYNRNATIDVADSYYLKDKERIKKEGVEKGLEVVFVKESSDGKEIKLRAPLIQRLAVNLAAGNLYPVNNILIELYRGIEGVIQEGSPQPVDVKQVVELYKKSLVTYRAAWQKQVPERLAEVERRLADVEWLAAEKNKIWKTAEAAEAVVKIRDKRGVFSLLSNGTPLDKRGTGNFFDIAWPFLIKRLLTDEDRLKNELMGQRIDRDGSDVFLYLDDPRFDPFLKRISDEMVSKRSGKKTFYVTDELSPEQKIRAVREALREGKSKDTQKEWVQKILAEGFRTLQWEDYLVPLKKNLQERAATITLKEAEELQTGFFRDFFLYEIWKREGQSAETIEGFLEKMDTRVPDGAQANRAPDLMSGYIKEHYAEGTEMSDDPAFQLEMWLNLQREAPAHRVRGKKVHTEVSVKDIHNLSKETQEQMVKDFEQAFGVSLDQASGDYLKDRKNCHEGRKARFEAEAEDADYTPSRLMYVFSDVIKDTPEQRAEVVASFKMRLLAQKGIAELMVLQKQAGNGALERSSVIAGRDWVQKHLPEACLMRDFFLENYFNLSLWLYVENNFTPAEIKEMGVELKVRQVDLEKHLAGKDSGVLSGAYITRYMVMRVEGLAANLQKLDKKKKREVAGLIGEWSPLMTAGAAETYERMAVEADEDFIIDIYRETFEDALPKDGVVSEAQLIVAGDKAFARVLQRIIKIFPRASYNRDSLLEKFALDCASTPEHIKAVEELTYGYLMRRPDRDEKDNKTVFAPVEAVRDYLANFSDAGSRANIMSWIFGGVLPDDRYLEGQAFGVNPNDERDLFWKMSPAERRAVLYSAMLGKFGVFEDQPVDLKQPTKKPELLNGNEFEQFLEAFYANNIETVIDKTKDERMNEVLRTVFFTSFRCYSPARRVEILLAITEKMKDAKARGEKIQVGQAVKLFLEQVGVVGIKAGQVISEQRDLATGELRSELSSLRDRAAPFNKFGVNSYLSLAEMTGLRAGKNGGIVVTRIGECLGSASIKQVHKCRTADGKDVAVAVPRPSIDKYYEEDIRVIEEVIKILRDKGFAVPEHLLKEVVDACAIEFDFGQEGQAQEQMRGNLATRKANILSAGAEMPMSTPALVKMVRKGEARVKNLQLIASEYIPGFSLSELEGWLEAQANKGEGETTEQKSKREKLEARLHQDYGAMGAIVGLSYGELNPKEIRAQLAIEIITEIFEDGLFHADLHSGNVKIDMTPKAPRLCLIDFGSVGRTKDGESDYRADFKDFITNLILLKLGLGDAGKLGAIVSRFVKVDGVTQEDWVAKLKTINGDNEKMDDFFKGLLGEILAQKGEINRQFKMLIKSLAAAGGHFESLKDYAAEPIMDAVGKVLDGAEVDTVLASNPMLKKIAVLVDIPSIVALYKKKMEEFGF